MFSISVIFHVSVDIAHSAQNAFFSSMTRARHPNQGAPARAKIETKNMRLARAASARNDQNKKLRKLSN